MEEEKNHSHENCNSDSGGDSDRNVVNMRDARKIAEAECMSGPLLGNNFKVSGSDCKSKPLFVEEIIGETTFRFCYIRQSKINKVLYNKVKEPESLYDEASVTFTKVKDDRLAARSVTPKNLANVSSRPIKDEVDLKSTRNKCLEKFLSLTTKNSEPTCGTTAESTGVKTNEAAFKTEISQEKFPLIDHLCQKFAEFLEFHFSLIQNKRSVETEGEKSDAKKMKQKNVFERLSETFAYSSNDQAEKNYLRYKTKVCSSKLSEENFPFEFQNVQTGLEALDEEYVIQSNTHLRDMDEIKTISLENYHAETKRKEHHLHSPNLEDLSGTQTETCLLVCPIEEHFSDLQAEEHFSGTATKKRLSVSPVLESLAEPHCEQLCAVSLYEESLSELKTQEYLSESKRKEHLSGSKVEKHLPESKAEGYFPESKSEKHLPESETEEHLPGFKGVEHFPESKAEEYLPESEAEEHVPESEAEEHVPESEAEEHVPESEAEEHVPESEAEEHVPESEAEEHVPESKADEYLPESKADEYLPESRAKEHVPQSKAKEHVPKSKAEEYLPESKIVEHLLEFKAEEYLQESKTEEHHPESKVEKNLPEFTTDLLDFPLDNSLSCSSAEELLSEFSVKDYLPSAPAAKRVSDSLANVTPTKEQLSDSPAVNRISNNSGEERRPEIKNYSSTFQEEISKIQIDHLNAKILETQSDLSEAKTEKDPIHFHVETCDRGIEECSLKMQMVTTETRTISSETEIQEYASDVRSEIEEIQTEEHIADSQLKGSLSHSDNHERSTDDRSKKSDFWKSSETQVEKNFPEVQSEAPKIQIEGDPTESPAVKSISKSKRKLRMPDDCEDQGSSKTTENFSLNKSDSNMDQSRESHKDDLLKKETFSEECSEITEAVHYTEYQLHGASVRSASHELKIPIRPPKGETTNLETDCPSSKILQEETVVTPDYENSSEKLKDTCNVADDSSAKGIVIGSVVQNPSTSGTKNLAYSAGDKIYELSPLVYVLDKEKIRSFCSYCFRRFESPRKVRCSTCTFAFYCDQDCQDDHLEIHSKECPYICRTPKSRIPENNIRLMAHLMWKLEVSSSLELGYTVGDRTYRYKDVPLRKGLILGKESSPELDNLCRYNYHQLRKFIYDQPVSYEEFCNMCLKVLSYSIPIREDPEEEIGTGMYLGLSAVDVSCNPNANLNFIGPDIQIMAFCDIPFTDRHRIAVRLSFNMVPRSERQAELKFYTGELCNCKLCQSDEFEEKINEVKGRKSSSAIINAALNSLKQINESTDKNDEEQLKIAEQALEMMCDVAGTYHYVRVKILQIAAKCSFILLQYPKAIFYYQDLLQVFRYIYGVYNCRNITIHENLSMSYQKMSVPRAARRHYVEALHTAYFTYGYEHPMFKKIRYTFIYNETHNWENI